MKLRYYKTKDIFRSCICIIGYDLNGSLMGVVIYSTASHIYYGMMNKFVLSEYDVKEFEHISHLIGTETKELLNINK